MFINRVISLQQSKTIKYLLVGNVFLSTKSTLNINDLRQIIDHKWTNTGLRTTITHKSNTNARTLIGLHEEIT